MVQTEAEGGPRDEPHIILLSSPHYPFRLSEGLFTRIKNGDKQSYEAKGTLHTAELPDIELFMQLRTPKSASRGTFRSMEFSVYTRYKDMQKGGLIHAVRTSSSLGQTTKYEQHPEFLPGLTEQFMKLGMRVSIPASENYNGGIFDGLIDRERLSNGLLGISTFFDRERDVLQPEPLVIPIIDRVTLQQLSVTFTYEKPAVKDVFLRATYDFENLGS